MSHVFKNYLIMRYMTSSFSYVLWYCDCDIDCCDVILSSFTKFKIRRKRERSQNKNKRNWNNGRKVEKEQVYYS